MTQDDLKDYLELPEHECYLYKTKVKHDGMYYFMRRNKTVDIAVLFPPKKGVYKEENVCHICKILKVATPEWAKSAQQTLDDAERETERRKKEKDDNENAP